MAINRNKPDGWKADIASSVDLFNSWFMKFAPKAFRDTRVETTKQVISALHSTKNLTAVDPETLKKNPRVVQMLRMCTCPPIARDRVIGLSGVSKNLVNTMEKSDKVPPSMGQEQLGRELGKIGTIIEKMADKDIFVWLDDGRKPTEEEVNRASTVVADRLCGAVADPIIRNAQEERQLKAIAEWLQARGYRRACRQ